MCSLVIFIYLLQISTAPVGRYRRGLFTNITIKKEHKQKHQISYIVLNTPRTLIVIKEEDSTSIPSIKHPITKFVTQCIQQYTGSMI